jgi:hypothetical protein
MQSIQADAKSIANRRPTGQSRLIWLDGIVVGIDFGTIESVHVSRHDRGSLHTLESSIDQQLRVNPPIS